MIGLQYSSSLCRRKERIYIYIGKERKGRKEGRDSLEEYSERGKRAWRVVTRGH